MQNIAGNKMLAHLDRIVGEHMYCCHKPYQIIGHILDPDILEKKNRAATDMAGCDIPCRMTGPNMYVHEMLLAGRKDACFI